MRKRERSEPVWLQASVLKLLRGRQVLGLQEVGHYENGKRVVAEGQYTEPIPPRLIRGCLMRSKLSSTSGSRAFSTGRNVTHYSNLLGDLARCGVCGERMKLHSRERGRYAYFGCSNAFVGEARAHQDHRLADVERDLFALLANLTWQDRRAG